MARFKVILAGCGGMAHKWMEYLTRREDVEIVGLCDIVIEKAAEFTKKFSVNLNCGVYGDINNALAACPLTNLVVDCTSSDAHELIVTSALRFGADVIGEKPMADTREQALNQIAVADKTGKSYAVMQNRIYQPGMRTIRKAVGENLIGKLCAVSSDFFVGVRLGGYRQQMENVLLVDMSVHTFYQARYIIGANPVSVYCHEFNPPSSQLNGKASAIAIFEFENGVIYDYRGSWGNVGHNTSWESEWRVFGEFGSLKWDGGANLSAQTIKPGGTGFEIERNEMTKLDFLNIGRNHQHDGCFDEMFAALIENRPAETDCHGNYYSMNMVYGAVESAKYGKKVML
jgi:predicted dehydrogenase